MKGIVFTTFTLLNAFEIVCGRYKQVNDQRNSSLSVRVTSSIEKCGFRNSNGVGFQNNIMGESELGEFPWMVAILKENITNDFITISYQCGGALITSQSVLTAAHCVHREKASSLKVRFGEWDTQTKDERFPYSEYYVSDIIIHEAFNNANLHNDIAIMVLKTKIEIAPHINTICLPEQNDNYDGKRCFVSGWGKDTFGREGMYQTILKKIEVPTVPFIECQNKLRKARMGRNFILNNSFMCAGGELENDACTGDGGSPLICPIGKAPGQYYLAGIVSWGVKCGSEGVPGVYVNVANFRSWIDLKLLSRNLQE